jgi:hypothetical protein
MTDPLTTDRRHVWVIEHRVKGRWCIYGAEISRRIALEQRSIARKFCADRSLFRVTKYVSSKP